MSKELDKLYAIAVISSQSSPIGNFNIDKDACKDLFNSELNRLKSQLLVKVINKLSSELGHPKDDLVYLIKEMIKKGEL